MFTYPIRLTQIVFCLLTGLVLGACHKGVGEVVETGYADPILAEPQYKFSRGGGSSVNTLECGFLKDPLDYIYSSYLKHAELESDTEYKAMMLYYTKGEFGLAPQIELASSKRMALQRIAILKDFERLLASSAKISGYGTLHPYKLRVRHAYEGSSGFVGINIGDKNIFFVDTLGVAPAEVFRYYALGAIYLDKVLNVHLSNFSGNAQRLIDHQDLVFPRGHNYTELEHQWDLAYGYSQLLQELTVSDGLIPLKDTQRTMLYAFIEGRRALADFRYEYTEELIRKIRLELSRAFAVRVINLLQGPNTLANLNSQSKYTLLLVSQAIGLIRSLPFTLRENGEPYISYADAEALVADLLSGKGLWEQKRLAADVTVKGSLANIAERVAKIYGLNRQDIQR